MGVYEDDYQSFVNYWVSNIALPRKSDESLTMGSAVDVLLTKPEEFDSQFIIYTGQTPTGQMLSFCQEMAKLSEQPDVCFSINEQTAYDKVGIKGSKLETVIAKYEPFKPYTEFLINRENKHVLSIEQSSKAHKIVEELKMNKYTAPFVNAKADETHEVHNQLELYNNWEQDGVVLSLKGALDRVLVSHEKKIIQPIDFKTSFNVLQFDHSYFKYRYYRQASYYTYLLARWAEERGLGDYKIPNFMFVVCSTSGGQHWLYRQASNDLVEARLGGETYGGYKIKGWEQILNEIVFLTKSREWAFPYEAQTNNGIIELNIFK